MALHIAHGLTVAVALVWCAVLAVDPPWTAEPGHRIAAWLVAGLVTVSLGGVLVATFVKGF